MIASWTEKTDAPAGDTRHAEIRRLMAAGLKNRSTFVANPGISGNPKSHVPAAHPCPLPQPHDSGTSRRGRRQAQRMPQD